VAVSQGRSDRDQHEAPLARIERSLRVVLIVAVNLSSMNEREGKATKSCKNGFLFIK